ncbi:MAG: MJ0042-type zinc finger domain-containing protein [Candidatus Thorarchaeota archaeon]
MESAEILGIDEEDLHGFMEVLPNIWEYEKPIFFPELKLTLSKFGETPELLFGVYIYSVGGCIIVAFLEYQREFTTAIFEIHGFCSDVWDRPRAEFQFGEKRLRDIIMKNAGKDYKAFSSIPPGGLFVCPNCRAQYTFRSMKVSADGKVECQNCGRLVGFRNDEEQEKGVS